METSYQELKQKQVVNVCDGKQLGKVCDVVFTFPEGRVIGIVVPGGKGFRWGKGDLFIDVRNVTKIGVDTVLAEIRSAPGKKDKKKGKWEDYAPPPPPSRSLPSPPPPPEYFPSPGGRRDYGEYE